MAANFPGPFELRFNYVTDEVAAVREHNLRLSLEMAVEGAPGSDFSDWSAARRGGGSTQLDTLALEVYDAAQDMFSVAVDFTTVELWEYAPGTFDAIFRSVYAINLPGTSGAPSVLNSQLIYTFRTTTGGIAKSDWRGTVVSPGGFLTFPTGNAVFEAWANFVASATTPFLGRDGGYIMAALKLLPGQNEHAFKEALR